MSSGAQDALARVLGVTGLAIPRGLAGEEVRRLAEGLDADAPAGEVDAAAGAVAAAHWPELRGAMEAAVRRGLSDAPAGDAEAFGTVLGWAGDPDPDNPLARALAVRVASELLGARARAREHLRSAETAAALGGAPAAVAAAAGAGGAVVELLDLDPEDYEPEILAYVEADGAPAALDALARATGELDVRGWARRELTALEAPATPSAQEAVRRLASGPVPEDPAADLVWVPTILALAQRGLELAAAATPPDRPSPAA